MASKTISLDTEAYERLKATGRGNESFSDVVKRITLPAPKGTGRDLKKLVESGIFGKGGDWSKFRPGTRRRSRNLGPVR